jgi:hypothetical protein
MVELHLHSPICIHGVVLNNLSTGRTHCLLTAWGSALPAFSLREHVTITNELAAGQVQELVWMLWRNGISLVVAEKQTIILRQPNRYPVS